GPTSDIYSVGVVLYEMLTGSVPFTGDTPLEIAMKHLSAIPQPPSAKRPEVPHELDSIVLRALAKRPEDRYQSAEEMDLDLARVARGQAVAPETEEMATQVLRGAGLATTISSAPTEIVQRPVNVMPPMPPTPYGPPTGFYEYDQPMRRRTIWPWLLAALLVVAAVAGGWYVYTKIQDQLNQTKPVSVPLVVGSVERLAREKLLAAGLNVRIRRLPNATVVVEVSSGKPKVSVPNVVGKQSTDAAAALAERGLKANVHYVHSEKDSGIVTGQFPKVGTRLLKGERVRINVSQGPKPVGVPPVVGSPFESAAGALQGT